ncbi:MAG: MBL fold metallo-hydrolase [Scrofimicrobium sp.]
MRLTIVGSTGSMSGPVGAASCYLVQADGVDPDTGEERTWSLIMDLGPGAFGQLWKFLTPRDLDAVLISHGHADHMADIISLQVYLKWHPEGEIRGLPVYGPEETPTRIVQVEGYRTNFDEYGAFDFRPVQHGTQFEVGPMKVSAFHGLHTVESYGFRIEGPSDRGDDEVVTIAYTGDTDSCDAMEEMARNVDLLLAECGFTDGVEVRGIHLSGTRAAELAQGAGAKSLVLTHIQPWTDTDIPLTEAESVLGVRPEIAKVGGTWSL